MDLWVKSFEIELLACFRLGYFSLRLLLERAAFRLLLRREFDQVFGYSFQLGRALALLSDLLLLDLLRFVESVSLRLAQHLRRLMLLVHQSYLSEWEFVNLNNKNSWLKSLAI